MGVAEVVGDQRRVGGDDEALAEVRVEVAVAGEEDEELVLRLELVMEILGELGQDLLVGGVADLFDVEAVEGGERLVEGVGVGDGIGEMRPVSVVVGGEDEGVVVGDGDGGGAGG